MASDEVDLKDAGTPTCCASTIEYSKFYMIWTIKNFSYCRQPTGEALSSCIFSAEEPGSLKFRLDLYPRGTRDFPEDIVIGIRLVTDKNDLKVLVKYDCLLVRDQKPYHRQQGECVLVPGQYCHPVKLMTRSKLFEEKSLLFPDDVLGLACSLSTSYKEETGVPEFKIKSLL